MDNDDLPIGRVLDRREAVKLLAMTGAAIVVGCNRSSAAAADSPVAAGAGSASLNLTAVPGCVVKPELTEGPYFVDNQLNRSDIRSDPVTGQVSPGKLLDLTFTVSQVSNGKCVPLKGAMIDVWHCDAAGEYSGVNDQMQGFNTVGKKFLRGYQNTSDIGVANFTTIYPGWYPGRTVHIHFKIRTPHASDPNKRYDFTSQLFFDDALSDKVFAAAPYNSKGRRNSGNESDGIFRQSGHSLLLNVLESPRGYMAAFDIALDYT
jgi:protocatechuate 3,4-dioxygenase beta subunit